MIKSGILLTLSIISLGASFIPPLGSMASFALDAACAFFLIMAIRSFTSIFDDPFIP